MKFVDVSEHNGFIDWETVKSQIDGAIIRCGYGSDIMSQDDKKWLRNIDECERLNIPFGVYLYSYAKTTEQAKSEAEHVLRLVKGHELAYPIYYDLEQAGTEGVAVENAKVFCNIITKAGYKVGIYANEYWWKCILKDNFENIPKWVAKYSKNKPMISNYEIWQYTSSGYIKGITGNVDLSIGTLQVNKYAPTAEKPVTSQISAILTYNACVQEWQHAMNVGFDTNELAEDGLFGEKSEAFARSHLLKYNDKGHPTAVKWLQKMIGVTVDGIFGNETKNAVISFQKNYGLDPDGIVGLRTYKTLLGV